ncbi:MAG: phosphate-starvation-inducible PsiE family protein [Thermodesulfovibrionales bacterium]|nr:phosphate-starvation-inducible PsiE family protein [Thermodesulfovibrionales bacterium]
MRIFKKVTDIIIKLLIPLVILTLMIGIARVYLDLKVVFKSEQISKGFDIMVTNILTMFIVIELLRSIIDYFEVHRLKITFIVDAVMVFILREIMIGLYHHNTGAQEIIALAVLLLVLGGIRVLAVIYSPDRKEVKHE